MVLLYSSRENVDCELIGRGVFIAFEEVQVLDLCTSM